MSITQVELLPSVTKIERREEVRQELRSAHFIHPSFVLSKALRRVEVWEDGGVLDSTREPRMTWFSAGPRRGLFLLRRLLRCQSLQELNCSFLSFEWDEWCFFLLLETRHLLHRSRCLPSRMGCNWREGCDGRLEAPSGGASMC